MEDDSDSGVPHYGWRQQPHSGVPNGSSGNVGIGTQYAGNHLSISPLEEGETLNLNCLIRHQQNQSSQIEAHWYKNSNQQNESGLGKETESLHLSQNSDPKAKVTSSLLLEIQEVKQSGSGHYQCRAKTKNTLLTAVGHLVRVNVTGVSIVSTTERTEGDLEKNKALRVDSELEKMWAVVMISWIIVYVKEGATELDSAQHPRKSPGSVSNSRSCQNREH